MRVNKFTPERDDEYGGCEKTAVEKGRPTTSHR